MSAPCVYVCACIASDTSHAAATKTSHVGERQKPRLARRYGAAIHYEYYRDQVIRKNPASRGTEESEYYRTLEEEIHERFRGAI